MSVEIIIGDALTELRKLPSDSVDCCVTSPPYWGLRDYGTAAWSGGAADCDHALVTNADPKWPGKPSQNGRPPKGEEINRQHCRCGAARVDAQLGLEQTYQEHVSIMADLFDEVRRILKPAGTLWLNYGDSYATSVNGRSAADTKALTDDDRTFRDKPFSTVQGVLKPKDLCGIPWRVAFALQERGWYLRQDIIWAKPNPMPESIGDRCTKAHEYLFLLAKSPRYYFDAEAIREPSIGANVHDLTGGQYAPPGQEPHTGTRRPPGNKTHKGAAAYEAGDEKHRTKAGLVAYAGRERARVRGIPPRHALYPESSDQSGLDAVGRGEGRNRRSVWTVATQPFSEAHFATFPPELIEPCILAGCPVGGTCLDPFGGAGTTGLVADRLQRNAILIELNPEYAAMARRRIDTDRGALLDAMEAA